MLRISHWKTDLRLARTIEVEKRESPLRQGKTRWEKREEGSWVIKEVETTSCFLDTQLASGG